MIDNQQISGLTARQKAMAGVLAVITVLVAWQLYSLILGKNRAEAFSFGSKSATTTTKPMPATPPVMVAKTPKVQPMSQADADLLKLQQDTQAKYLAALNELQMLKVARDIAEANKEILTAKLATVKAQKSIVDILQPPPPPVPVGAYAKGLLNGGAASLSPEVSYTAVAVSFVQSRWNAVLGYQGNLYSVHIGDVLPADGSKVLNINKNGVSLEKDGATKHISMVPII